MSDIHANDLLDFLSKGEAWQAIRGMDAPGLAAELDAAGFRRPEPQDEPSDAQVIAAFNAFFGLDVDQVSEGTSTRMRAALRAAGVTHG